MLKLYFLKLLDLCILDKAATHILYHAQNLGSKMLHALKIKRGFIVYLTAFTVKFELPL